MNDTNLPISNSAPQDSYINAYTPPAPAQSIGSTQPQVSPTSQFTPPTPSPVGQSQSDTVTGSEKIEDQNIFFLMGVTEGTEEEKESFLDELQQVIWEDFLDNDVDLLLTAEEKSQLDKLKATAEAEPEEAQEAMVIYLEKLIPDLEEIMLEKALELKEDMVRERIAGLKEYFDGQQDKLDQLTQAEGLISENKWMSAAQKLNSLVA